MKKRRVEGRSLLGVSRELRTVSRKKGLRGEGLSLEKGSLSLHRVGDLEISIGCAVFNA